MDITNRAGTITYHIKPTDRVRVKGERGWWFVDDYVNGGRYIITLSRTSDARDNGVYQKFFDHKLFCDLLKDIKPSLEADLEKEAL